MTSIVAINKILDRHGALLEQIWTGEVTRIDEEISGRAITELKAVHAIMTDGEGNIRLSRHYREFLERVLGARGHYSASRSVADDLNRLKAAADDASDAAARQDDVSHERAISEGSDIIWELTDTIESSTLAFERILHDGLGESGSRAARIRRLEYYKERIRGLRESLNLVVSGPAREAISLQACRDLRREHTRMIGSRLAGFVQRVNRASDEINRLLILDQNIQAETRRTRAILRALKDMTLRERVEALMLDADTAILPGIVWNPLVDPRDPDLEDMRERVAMSMKPAPRRVRQPVEGAGQPASVTIGEAMAAPPVGEADDALVLKFHDAVDSGQRLSLREWIGRNAGEGDDPALLFEEIMSDVLVRAHEYAIDFAPPLSRNSSNRIHDIIVGLAR